MSKLFWRIVDWCFDEPKHIGKLFVWMWLCMTLLSVCVVAILSWVAAVAGLFQFAIWLFS